MIHFNFDSNLADLFSGLVNFEIFSYLAANGNLVVFKFRGGLDPRKLNLFSQSRFWQQIYLKISPNNWLILIYFCENIILLVKIAVANIWATFRGDWANHHHHSVCWSILTLFIKIVPFVASFSILPSFQYRLTLINSSILILPTTGLEPQTSGVRTPTALPTKPQPVFNFCQFFIVSFPVVCYT